MNPADIIVISVVAALAAAAVVVILIRRRRGKRCSCGCEGCAFPCGKSADRKKRRCGK